MSKNEVKMFPATVSIGSDGKAVVTRARTEIDGVVIVHDAFSITENGIETSRGWVEVDGVRVERSSDLQADQS
jgi:hypothetical protein